MVLSRIETGRISAGEGELYYSLKEALSAPPSLTGTYVFVVCRSNMELPIYPGKPSCSIASTRQLALKVCYISVAPIPDPVHPRSSQ